MKTMADLDEVRLGLDENEADIAEELQHFDDSFDTRSEASESSEPSEPSISSVSTTYSNKSKQKHNLKTKIIEKKPQATIATPLASGPLKNVKEPGKKLKRTNNANSSTLSVKDSTVINGKSSTSSSFNSNKKKRSNFDAKIQKGEENLDTAANSSVSATIKKADQSGSMKKLGKKVTDINQTPSANSNMNSNINMSDEEGVKTKRFDSDSESEDSDSAANIKRNSGKNVSIKPNTPEKKITVNPTVAGSGAGSGSGGAAKGVSLYDYKTKLNYLFRDTRFFLIKSNNTDNITIAKTQNVWATLPQNDVNLSQAFKEARNILLIFSVNESGRFAGFARMNGPSRRDLTHPPWLLPSSMSTKALGGVIEIDWICRKELSFSCTSHLYNSWNDGKPIKIGRDGQEIEPKVGAELCRLFPEDDKIELTPILRKSKETAKMMREKNIKVVYRPPKSLSSRGGGGNSAFGGSNRGNNNYRYGSHGMNDRREMVGSGGPIRHKRTYGNGPPRPYKVPSHTAHSMPNYKRGGSPPYRGPSNGGGGPGNSGTSRAGGGDIGLPPWERYMTPAAAAEAYLADYMRTMHGQLPPLPFVPPFGQLPPPTPGGTTVSAPGGSSGSMYEQLPPPGRYYDGPPLPDYPPPQSMRPPPPGFDKSAPSYEDFAAWKHAGLPTGSLPGSFPSSLSSGGGGSGGPGSGNSGVGGNSSNQSYRGLRGSDINTTRSRNERNARNVRNERNFRSVNERSVATRSYRDNRR